MKRKFNSYFFEKDLTFPLTLSQAVWRLAFQRTENFKNLSIKEQYQIYKKTWQQLSVRLRLIFKKFPKTINKIVVTPKSSFTMDLIGDALLNQLSETRFNSNYEKLLFIYFAVTMCYIQHIDSPLSTEDVSEKWIQGKKFKNPDFKEFLDTLYYDMGGTDHLLDLIVSEGKELSMSNQVNQLTMLSDSTIIENIDCIEKLIQKNYDYITKKFITPEELQTLLSDSKKYDVYEEYILLHEKSHHSPVGEKLKAAFKGYTFFCKCFDILQINYNTACEHIDESSFPVDFQIVSALPEIQDKNSNIITEISQLEFEFFDYLLESIPTRGKNNITNQLSYGKWYILPINVRNQIVDYITQMSQQPKRLIRFMNPDDLDEETIDTTMLEDLQNLYRQIRWPHQLKAYQSIIALHNEIKPIEEIIFSDDLDNIIEKFSEIHKDLRKAQQENAQYKQQQ